MKETTKLRVCSFWRIQKRILDPRFARFRGRKEREIRNWICNLGNLSPTRAICTTASQEMTCFLLFDKLCDYTVQNLVVGSSNSHVWMAIQDVYFNCCIQRNKWSFHLRWQVPPNLVLCPASAGKSPENFGRFGGLLLWLRDLWYPQELNFQERTLSLLSRLQHWRMDSQFRVLLSHKHYFHERWTIASK